MIALTGARQSGKSELPSGVTALLLIETAPPGLVIVSPRKPGRPAARATRGKTLPGNSTAPWRTRGAGLSQLFCIGPFLNLALSISLNSVGIFCFHDALAV